MKYNKIAIISSDTKVAQERLAQINSRYKFIQLNAESQNLDDIDLIIVLGGDGFMLHSLHHYMHLNIPIYGINCGTVGFLLNHFDVEGLVEHLEEAVESVTYPLEMTAKTIDGNIKVHSAINEVSLFRKTSQATRIKIIVDGKERLPELVSDGVLLATPAGSSAYNSSVNGPVLPMGSDILALTPISPFSPKRWSGALLPHTATVELVVLEPDYRPVNAVADFLEVESVASVIIKEKRDIPIRLLFDPNHSLEERILKEQFFY